mmetsp:Transcript_5474/g.10430  ORF Transcript_5474/g.10430 Transcript_5474/m.10430 type:complete len:237 (+) Transcript_5474:156-866(+)
MKTYALEFFIVTMSHLVNIVPKAYCIRPAVAAFSFMTTGTTNRIILTSTNNNTPTTISRSFFTSTGAVTRTTTTRFMTTTDSSSPSSPALPEYGNPNYGLTKKLASGITFPEAIAKVTDALKVNGFGILTEIDLCATMQKKLNVDIGRPYTILGACNPKLALNALQNAPAVGLFLPCNVAVLEDPDGRMVVSIVSPEEMFSIAATTKDENGSSLAGGVEVLAKEVQEIMVKVIAGL